MVEVIFHTRQKLHPYEPLPLCKAPQTHPALQGSGPSAWFAFLPLPAVHISPSLLVLVPSTARATPFPSVDAPEPTHDLSWEEHSGTPPLKSPGLEQSLTLTDASSPRQSR